MRPKLSILSAILLGSTLLLGGCARRNKPATAAAPEPQATIEVPSAPAAPTAPVPADPVEADPLSGDLAAVNEHLRSQGLLGDVYFGYDRAELAPEARERLARSAAFLKENPQFLLTLEGHCDERGTEEYNLALGERRSSVVRQYLAALGVDAERLGTLSYGEERPACTDSDESCWRQNRRAHPVITGRRDR